MGIKNKIKVENHMILNIVLILIDPTFILSYYRGESNRIPLE